MLKEYNNLDYSDFYVRLALDLEKAYKTIKKVIIYIVVKIISIL